MPADRLFAVIGSVMALLAVAAGAFGAHALRERLTPEVLTTFETAARYQMYHAFALFAAGWVWSRWNAPQAVWAGWLFVAGIVVFSGSLYLLALTGTRWWGAVTPFGGAALIAGWAGLAWSLLARP
ncbi:MAG TPA: DUF423 domain-containing protein [Gemmatimonadales bacterium]